MEYNDGSSSTYNDFAISESFIKITDTAKVTFENNTLTQEYKNHTDSYGTTYTGKIEIKFSDDKLDYVSSFSAYFKETHSEGNSTETTLSASNIPRDESVSDIRFKLKGEEVCVNINSLSQVKRQSNGTVTLVDESWKCKEYSEILIHIFIP